MKRLSLFFILLTLISGNIFAGVMAPFTRKYQSETEHFIFVYSESTRSTARYISGWAEEMYSDISQRLDHRTPQKITVVLTDDYQGANGYNQGVPYNHIVLYVHPSHISSVIGNNRDYFKALFLHELTHALSFTVKGPLMELGAQIFGAWVTPQSWMNPWFMIEGIAVAYESSDGFGRGNDPYVGDDIRQDILEGRMKGISQASGAYDLYPGGRIQYHYGGYFNAYLLKKYGPEKYRELWLRQGGGNPLLLLPGNFRRTYKFKLRQAWQDFEVSMKIPFTVAANTNQALPGYYDIYSMDTDGRYIYFQDDFDYNIYRFDTQKNRKKLVLHADWHVGRISLSEDGKRLLISRASLERGNPRLLVQIYDLEQKRFTQNYSGLREAAFFREGIIAIRPRGFHTDLIWVVDEQERILLAGDDETYFGTPWQWQDNRVLFTLKDKGIKKIAFLDTTTKTVSTWEADPLQNIRDLQVNRDSVTLSYHDNHGLYRWIIMSNETLTVYTNHVSGGVHQPVQTGSGVYYAGRFSQGERLMKWPSSWQPAGTKNLLLKDWIPTQDIRQSKLTNTLEDTHYKALYYIRPHVWAPYVNADFGIPALSEAGVMSYLSDPTGDNVIIPILSYNLGTPFLNLDLDWRNTAFSLPWSVRIRDRVYTNTLTASSYRQLNGELSLSYTWYFLPVNRRLTLGADTSHILIFEGTSDNSAYQWPLVYQNTILGAWTRYSSLLGTYPRFNARGLQLSLYYDYHIQTGLHKLEAGLLVTPEGFPLYIRGHVSYTPDSYQTMSGSHQYFIATYAPRLPEYSAKTDFGDLYVYGALYTYLFNWEIQRGTGAVPFYINRLYAEGGFRMGGLPVPLYSSVYTRLTLDMTWGNVFDLKAYIEGWYAFENESTWGFYWGLSTDLSFLGLAQPESKHDKAAPFHNH